MYPVEHNRCLFQKMESQPSCEYQKVLIARGKKICTPAWEIPVWNEDWKPPLLSFAKLTDTVYLDCFFIPLTFGHGQCFHWGSQLGGTPFPSHLGTGESPNRGREADSYPGRWGSLSLQQEEDRKPWRWFWSNLQSQSPKWLWEIPSHLSEAEGRRKLQRKGSPE